MGIHYTTSEILLSFIGYESIGNSNWYMFVIFCLYLFTLFSFKLFDFKDKKFNILIVLLLSIICMIVLPLFKEGYYVDTILCFSLGMFYSYYKDRINKYIKSKYLLILFSFIIFFEIFYLLQVLFNGNVILYNIWSCFFVLIIVLLSMKFIFNNKIYYFFGKHIFWIYIFQRLPMLVLQNIITNTYIYFALCFMITICLSIIFKKITDKFKM